ncbi:MULTISPECIES: PQQ-binding-like beta-propeller repeat protein [Streptomyces]|uniref:PQQ-binding-like beta-propeller repeat protein n=2 Tax=Streptomyces TaxID=1883 RepID=A0ABV9ILL3_9ACTN
MTQPPPDANTPPEPTEADSTTPEGFGAPVPPPAGGFGAPVPPPAGGFGAPPAPAAGDPGAAAPPPAGGSGGAVPPPPEGFGAPVPPPAGGFGAPVPPPAGGFGAPVLPANPVTPPNQAGAPHPAAPLPPASPAQPGYAYPPPPAPQPGYGYPAAAPQPPYGGAPQPPYGQAPQAPQPPYGYGYPGQPTVPLQSAPAGRTGRRVNAQWAIIVSAVVAIALIVGGGVWYSKSSGGGGKQADPTASGSPSADGKDSASKGTEKVPADPSAKALFQLPMPTVAKDDSVAIDGSWVTDKAYVKTGVAEIVGYDRDKGTRLWTVKLPGPVCAASRRTNDDNRTAIVFQPKMPAKNSTAGCTQISAIDLNAGRSLWTKTVSSGDTAIDFDNVTVSANTVAVGGSDGGAAFDVTAGGLLWKPKASDTCYDAGYGGGAKLVAVRKCGTYDARQLHLQTIDPTSGKVQSEYLLGTDIEYAAVVSTDPLVVAADVGDAAGDGSGISDFFSIDNATGKLRTRISAPGDDYAAECDTIYQVEACTGLVVGNDRLYIATEEHESGDGSVNEVVAFDLATGKQTGQRADSGTSYTLYPLRMDGGNLIVYKEPSYGEGGQVVSIDGASFKETRLLENTGSEKDKEMESDMSPEYSEVLYSQGRLYMAETYADSSDSGDAKHLAIAFGTGG